MPAVQARSCLLLSATLLLCPAMPAHAQRAQENAATTAQDAFGRSVGNESIGLYASGEVRGFSAADAGNARIEGLYFSKAGNITELLQAGSSIRVGLSAFGQSFPAPTGIVDTDLRRVNAKHPVITARASSGDFLGADYTLEAAVPVSSRLGVYGVIGLFDDRFFDGSDGRYLSHGAVARWRPLDQTEVTGFYSFYTTRDEEQGPLIYTAAPALPRPIARRRYFGQDWADVSSYTRNYGGMAKSRLGNWQVALGLFQSDLVQHTTASQWLSGVDAAGWGQMYARTGRDQSYATTSGEARLSRQWITGSVNHRITFSLRGRDGDNAYGGYALQSLGIGQIGTRNPQAVPAQNFGPLTIDKVRQRQWGIGYDVVLGRMAEINLGLIRNDYRKSVAVPDQPINQRAESGWLWNGALALHVTRKLSLYAASTRGLEESGTAPGNAANAGEVMPALRTRQVEAGLRWTMPNGLNLVADWFDLAKPYFETDPADNAYRIMGQVRHTGVELSLSGQVGKGVKLVAGSVLLAPKVSGAAVDEGRLGARPIGRTSTLVDGSIDWRLGQGRSRWSLDMRVLYEGRREADARNRFSIPARTTLDLGARYRFKLGKIDAMLRAKLANATNVFGWRVTSGGGFRTNIPRRATVALTVDY